MEIEKRTMNTPCKHGHFDGALHDPCYQCRSEAYADDIAELEKIVVRANKRLAIRREFTNELGNRIKITIEGPASTAENILTRVEAGELKAALDGHAVPEPIRSTCIRCGANWVNGQLDDAPISPKEVILLASEYAQLVRDARRYEGLRDKMKRLRSGSGIHASTRYFIDVHSDLSFQEAVDVMMGTVMVKNESAAKPTLDAATMDRVASGETPRPEGSLTGHTPAVGGRCGPECAECPAGDCLGCPRKPNRII